MTTAISVSNIGKYYRLGLIGGGTLREDLTRWWAKLRGLPDPVGKVDEKDFGNRDREFVWALRDVSFEVKEGEVLGIIGRNGAGKSTLLKILSKVTAPTSGEIKVKGRIASLLEVGTGFHPELTGRENIFMNGAILGMNRLEIAQKLDEIIDFSGVQKFIDTPVKRYSSGMYVRLAFAVAAHLEPEILIVDEVLAVGDAEFQKKCLGKMKDVATQGRTVLFVSHNMAAVQNLCARGILLSRGQLEEDLPIGDCIRKYMMSHLQANVSDDLASLPRISSYTEEARILRFSLRNEGSDEAVINADQPCIAEVTFEAFRDNVQVGAEFAICDEFQQVLLFHSGLRNGLFPFFNKGVHTFSCAIQPLKLFSGEYYVTLALSRPGVPQDYLERAVTIQIVLPHRAGSTTEFKRTPGYSPFFVEHSWRQVS